MTRIVVFIAVLSVASQAMAGRVVFDRDRKGPVAGFDIGGGFTSITSTNIDLDGTVTKGTVCFNYRVGYAPDRHWQVYVTHRSSVYASKVWEHYTDAADHAESKEVGYVGLFLFIPVIAMFTDQHFMIGAGGRYYAKERGQSWFFDAGIGLSDAADPYEWEVRSAFPKGTHEGWGFFGGVGYEFATHVGVALQTHWSRAEANKDPQPRDWSALSVSLVTSITAY